jgi:hypothetical protein
MAARLRVTRADGISREEETSLSIVLGYALLFIHHSTPAATNLMPVIPRESSIGSVVLSCANVTGLVTEGSATMTLVRLLTSR